jgi:hydrogenase nickel incorporation protein HypB
MKKVTVQQKILSANEETALKNQLLFVEKKKLCLNLISSPGSGKTTLLTRTIKTINTELRIGVIEGDIQTDLDAERIRATKAPAVQINTEGACHLSATQVQQALQQLPIDDLDLIMIENVGNLVCPGAFELGERGKVVVLSVAEGDDKPVKYPAIFAKSMALVINKIDLLALGADDDFDIEKVKADAKRLNPNIHIFPVSAKTGEGIDAWCKWLKQMVAGC